MTDIPMQDIPTYTRKDFMSGQTVRWWMSYIRNKREQKAVGEQ